MLLRIVAFIFSRILQSHGSKTSSSTPLQHAATFTANGVASAPTFVPQNYSSFSTSQFQCTIPTCITFLFSTFLLCASVLFSSLLNAASLTSQYQLCCALHNTTEPLFSASLTRPPPPSQLRPPQPHGPHTARPPKHSTQLSLRTLFAHTCIHKHTHTTSAQRPHHARSTTCTSLHVCDV